MKVEGINGIVELHNEYAIVTRYGPSGFTAELGYWYHKLEGIQYRVCESLEIGYIQFIEEESSPTWGDTIFFRGNYDEFKNLSEEIESRIQASNRKPFTNGALGVRQE